MMSVNGSCVEVAGFAGSSTNACGQLMMAARNPRANWQSLFQHQVNHRTVINEKWLNVVDEVVRRVQVGGKRKRNGRLAVEKLVATTSKTRIAVNQRITAFKFAAHSTPSPDQPNQSIGQTLLAREIPPSTVKLQPVNQYGQNGSYQKAKRVPTAQHFKGEDLLDIKVAGFLRELSLNPVALASVLLMFFSIPFAIQILEEILEEDAPDEAILEMIVIIAFVFVFVKQMEGDNHLSPNLLREGMQIATSTQFLLLCSLVFMGQVSGAHAGDSTHEGTKQRGSANVWEKSEYIKAAAFTLALMTIGGVVWRMLRRPANPNFRVDEGLKKSPIPRRNDPVFVIHPALP